MSGVVSGFNGRNGPVTLQQSDVVDVLPNATVSGAITVNGALSAATADVSGNITVGGALSGTTADLSGNATVGGALSVSGNASVNGALSTLVNLNGTLPAQQGQGFAVGWNYSGGADEVDFFTYPDSGPGGFRLYNVNSPNVATLLATLDNVGNFTIPETLNATAANLSSNVTVGGALSAVSADVSGPMTVGGALSGTTADLSGAVTVGGVLSGTTAGLSGNVTIGGALNVSGALTANGMLVQSFDTSGLPTTITTTNTTPGATLSAAEMISGSIIRTGPTVAFTDTTDTAANIVASFGSNPPVNASYQFVLINQTSVSDTLAAGSGVTISGSAIIAPENSVTFKVTVTDATSGSQAVTITRLFSGGT